MKILPAELSLGNLVYLPVLFEKMNDKGEVFGRQMFAANSVVIRDLEHYGDDWAGEPVPLTEDLLVEKFGFDKMVVENSGALEFTHKRFCLQYNGKMFYVFFQGTPIPIDFAHQLQNLYLIVMREQLTIIEKSK